MSVSNPYENRSEVVYHMAFNNDNINLGSELYFGTGAGKKMIGRLQSANFIKIMSPFLPKVSDKSDSLFQFLLNKLNNNKNLKISFVTRKGQEQINFMKSLINALNGNDDRSENLKESRKPKGFFQNFFDRQKEKEEPLPDFRSDRVRCFFIEDYKIAPGKKQFSLHAKLYIIDQTDVYFGSYNFTDEGVYTNIESSMHTTDPIVIQRTLNYYDGIVDQCIPNSF